MLVLVVILLFVITGCSYVDPCTWTPEEHGMKCYGKTIMTVHGEGLQCSGENTHTTEEGYCILKGNSAEECNLRANNLHEDYAFSLGGISLTEAFSKGLTPISIPNVGNICVPTCQGDSDCAGGTHNLCLTVKDKNICTPKCDSNADCIGSLTECKMVEKKGEKLCVPIPEVFGLTETEALGLDCDNNIEDCIYQECWSNENCWGADCSSNNNINKEVVWSYHLPLQEDLKEEYLPPEFFLGGYRIGCCKDDECVNNLGECADIGDYMKTDALLPGVLTNNKIICNDENDWITCDENNQLEIMEDWICLNEIWRPIETNCSDNSPEGGFEEFTDCGDITCDGSVGGPEGQLCEFETELNCTDGFDNDRDGTFTLLDILIENSDSPSLAPKVYMATRESIEKKEGIGISINTQYANSIIGQVEEHEQLNQPNPGEEIQSSPLQACAIGGCDIMFLQNEKVLVSTPTETVTGIIPSDMVFEFNGQTRTAKELFIEAKARNDVQLQVGNSKISATTLTTEIVPKSIPFGQVEEIGNAQVNVITAGIVIDKSLIGQSIGTSSASELTQFQNEILDALEGTIGNQLDNFQENYYDDIISSLYGKGPDCQDNDCSSQNKNGPLGAECCLITANCNGTATCGADNECHETVCDDSKDYDNDNRTDCEDSDCNLKQCGDKMMCLDYECKGDPGPGKAEIMKKEKVQIFSYAQLLNELNKCEVVKEEGVCNNICGEYKCVFADGGRKACSEEGSTKCTCC
jgi:hypothetical protein